MKCLLVSILAPLIFFAGRPNTATAQATDEAVARHITGLRSNDLVVRKSSALAFYDFLDRAAPAVPALAECLSDPDLEMRRYAAGVLERIGRPAEPTIPALREMQLVDDRYTRQTALDAIVKIAPQSIADAAALVAELKSPEMPRRRRAAETAARLKARAKPALNELIAALKDDAIDVRAAAALALGNMRAEARPAIDALLAASHDPYAGVRANVGQALTFIGPGVGHGDAIPHLLNALGDTEPAVRRNAAWALRAGWSGEQQAVPALVRALADRGTNGTDGAAIQAGYTLVDMAKRGHTGTIVTEILGRLKKPGAGHEAAVYVLGQIGPPAREAVPVLRAMLDGASTGPKQAAAVALVKIEAAPGEGVALLISKLDDDDPHVRERAVRDLGSLGPSAAAALPRMIARLGDQNEQATAAFRKAAEQGSPDGQFALAMQLRDGLGVPADATAAAAWLRKAAEQGHREAQRNLAILYRQGRGVARDDRQADAWYRKSVEPSALSRVKYAPDWEGESAEVLRYYESTEIPAGGPSSKLSVFVVSYENGGGSANTRFVDVDGFPGGGNMLSELSARWPTRHGDLEMERLRRLLAALPEGIGFVPVAERVLVAVPVDGKLKVRLYDREALPREVRRLLEFVGLAAVSVPYPPQEAASWRSPSRPPIEAAYRADGALVSWGSDPRLDVWTKARPAGAEGHEVRPLPAFPVAVAPAVERAVTNRNRELRLVDTETGTELADLGLSSDWNYYQRLAGFSADGRTLVVCQRGRLQIYDGLTGKLRGAIEADPVLWTKPAVSADGRWAAVSVHNNHVGVWDLETFTLVRQFADLRAVSLAFSPDGSALAVEGEPTLTVWDLTTGTKRWSVAAGNWSGPIAYSPDGKLLAEARRRPLVRLYDARDGRVLGIAESHTGDLRAITSMSFSPDGATFATTGEDGLIKVWNLADVLEETAAK